MFDGDKIREPDENSGPALLGREPMIMPEERTNAVENLRDSMQHFME